MYCDVITDRRNMNTVVRKTSEIKNLPHPLLQPQYQQLNVCEYSVKFLS